MMKKLAALALALILALGATGCQVSIANEQIPLADGTAVTPGTTQTLQAKALSAKVADPKAAIPTMVERKTGVNVLSNSKVTVEATNANEGYVDIKYTGGKNVTIAVQIFLGKDNTYTYYLNNKGNYETFALTEGNGKYTIRVLENTTGTKYACVYSCEVSVTLRSELLPFLYSNNSVNYADAPNSVKKAAELVAACTTDIEKVEAIYTYVVKNTTYDYDFANKIVAGTVSGHIPNLDTTLSTKKGICFDYASLMSGMLRSQNIPCRLVKGYAGTTYHAWINVFIQGVGWVDKVIQFDGTSWTMMDPTFVSTYGKGDAVEQFVGKGNAYTPKQIY